MRFAVSMVGGTSLAIHMNGTAQELNRMVRKEGAYAAVAGWTRTTPIIDILSGTSAGGINAMLLAAAIVNGTKVEQAERAFVSMGDIDTLIQPDDADAVSLLRGEDVVFPEMCRVFNQLLTPQTRANGREVDLLVTGSYLQGFPHTYFDSAGGRIYTKDHRGVFHFRHAGAGGGDSDLAGSAVEEERGPLVQRLARAARTTSSLPGVFEPSRVSLETFAPNGVGHSILPFPGQVDTLWMGDGGYLNGRPLDLVVDAITRRPVRGKEVVRKVLLVEPEPDPFEALRATAAPTAVEHLILYSRVASSQTLHGVLSRVDEHNRDADRVRRALAEAREVLAGATPDGWTVSEVSARLYASSCVAEIENRVRDLWAQKLGIRLGQLVEGNTPAESHEEVKRKSKILEEAVERFRRDLGPLADKLACELVKGASAPGALSDYDILAVERKALRAIDEVYAAVFPKGGKRGGTGVAAAAGALEALYTVYHKSEKLRTRWEQRIQCGLQQSGTYSLEDLRDNPPRLDPKDWQDLGLGVENVGDLSRLDEHIDLLVEEAAEALAHDPKRRGALAWIAAAKAARADATSMYFRWLDVHLFPLEISSGLRSRDSLDVVILDPHETLGLSNVPPEAKVAGDTLSKFGGFLRHTWRVNDVLWGRLDASAKLIKVLLDRERLKEVAREAPPLHSEVCRYLGIDPSAPGAGTEAGGRIGAYLAAQHTEDVAKALLWLVNASHPGRQDSKTDDDGWRALCEVVVLRHHLEILQEKLPDLLASDLVETARWQCPSEAGPLLQGVLGGESVQSYRAGTGGGLLPVVSERVRTLLGCVPVGAAQPQADPQRLREIHGEMRLGLQTVRDIPLAVTVGRAARLGIAAINAFRPSLQASPLLRRLEPALARVRGGILFLQALAATLQENDATRAAVHAAFLSIGGLLAILSLAELLPPLFLAGSAGVFLAYWAWYRRHLDLALGCVLVLLVCNVFVRAFQVSWPLALGDAIMGGLPAGILVGVAAVLTVLIGLQPEEDGRRQATPTRQSGVPWSLAVPTAAGAASPLLLLMAPSATGLGSLGGPLVALGAVALAALLWAVWRKVPKKNWLVLCLVIPLVAFAALAVAFEPHLAAGDNGFGPGGRYSTYFPPTGWPGPGILPLEFAASLDRGQALLAGWGAAGVQAAQSALVADYGFAFFYGALGFFGFQWLGRIRPWDGWRILAWCSALAASLDFLENSMLLLFLGLRSGVGNEGLMVAAVAASAKFALMAPMLVGMIPILVSCWAQKGGSGAPAPSSTGSTATDTSSQLPVT